MGSPADVRSRRNNGKRRLKTEMLEDEGLRMAAMGMKGRGADTEQSGPDKE